MIDKELLKKKDKLLELRDDLKRRGRMGKANFERKWYRNILFYAGKQWVVYNLGTRRWEDAKLDDWYPTPVTNKYAVAIKTIKSIIIKRPPRVNIAPATKSEQDMAVAKIGEIALEVANREAGLADADQHAAGWVANTGNVFFHNYFYLDPELGHIDVPFYSCSGCGHKDTADAFEEAGNACPKCGGVELSQSVGMDGNIESAKMPKGRLAEEAVSAFEMHFDTTARTFKDVRGIVRSKQVPLKDLKDMFPEISDKLGESQVGSQQGEIMLQALKFMTKDSGSAIVDSGGGPGAEPPGIIDYLYQMPTKEFPQGVISTIIGNEVVELSDFYLKDKDGRFWMPFVHAGIDEVPGAIWRKSPADDIAEKQVQRNNLESFCELEVYRGGASRVIVPRGSDMDPLTGQPYQVVEFNASPNRAAPIIMEGNGPNNTLLQMIEKIDQDIDDLAGTHDIIRGQRPEGVKTLGEAEILTEAAYGQHTEMLRSWEAAHEERARQKIELLRMFGSEARMRTIRKENGSWETDEFTNADLQGGMDISVEAGSGVPKSKAIENQQMLESIRFGLIDISDPVVKAKVLERLGQGDLNSQAGMDIEDAAREWNEFMTSVEQAPADASKWKTRPRNGIDNEPVHYADAMARAKTPEFFSLPPQAQKVWVEHAMTHKTNLDAQMAAQAAQAPMKVGPPMPGAPEPAAA